MKCNNTDSALIGYLLKTLSPAAEKRMQKHLAACDECRARLDRFARTQMMLDELHAPGPPGSLVPRAMNAIAGEGKDTKKNKSAVIGRKNHIEAMGKAVGSEQMRVYRFLIRRLGKRAGEAAFDDYLQEQMQLQFTTGDGSVLSYEDVVNAATGERAVRHTQGSTTCSTVENCSFPALAKEIGISTNPCATICCRQIKLIEKTRSLKIQCVRQRTHERGGCRFLIKPTGKSSRGI